MDHHIQSPKITSNHVTTHKNLEFSFLCAQLSTQVLPTPTGQSCSCAGFLQKQGICAAGVSEETQETESHTNKEEQNTSGAPLHVTWPYNCQADNLCSMGWVVQPGTWEVSQYHWDTSALSNYNLWPFLTGNQRGFISYALWKETYLFTSGKTSQGKCSIINTIWHLNKQEAPNFHFSILSGRATQKKKIQMILLNNSYPKFMNTGGKTTLLPCPNICIERPRTSLFQCLKISTVPLWNTNCKDPFELLPFSLIILFSIALVLLKSCGI